ncbi:alpha/beta fold hydrolase [Haloplanus aerogenes]|uniref:Alpha/beta hydrolase n=1 Tax=Haloplanus aerogenes TaxID=660522 RepID=A0A3M0DH59_9EURY|nr:alpha/beta hydrolase [Haloplanus aerogenes]AZH26082.1 alpha/beta hydrolase [Haloplanus aerogenes]RMB18469.1 pimeloyl-ACP methyl ester carboxylesterase [Haloplanus aerogenes]
METVTHHGRETAYRRHDRGGDGEPILFVHGSGGSHAVWKAQARLADARPVITLDLSGHGASEDVTADPGYEALSAYVDDTLAVAEATNAGVLCGNSLGGAVVLTLLLERDIDPEAVVLAGTGAKLAVLDDLLRWLRTDFERAIEFLHGPDRLFHDPDDRLLETSRAAFDDAGQAVTHRDFRTCHTFDVRGRLDEITTPTLAVVGEYDALTPPWYHEALAARMPDCEWTTLDDAAHLAMLERPEAFNDALTNFLEE